MKYPIDAVITWVDGDDERHKAKRMKYGNETIFNAEDIAGNSRFASLGEIFYCVASLNRFAPWINKIYIVTDEQDPQIDGLIEKYFPEKHIPMEIVDHKTIFRGYEKYLPTFNSISIESMTWRIPGLNERYIEFNDDFILAAPVTQEDFFTTDGKVVCYGKKTNFLFTKLSRLIKFHKDGTKKVTFKETMLNAASLIERYTSFIKMYHTPRALLKSVYEKYFNENPEHLTKNIAHRFRYHKQYNPQELFYLLMKKENRCTLLPPHKNLLYLKPKDLKYIQKKLKRFTLSTETKFGCFNAIDLACKEGQKAIIEWIEKRIGLEAV